jgi:hypothetical protein
MRALSAVLRISREQLISRGNLGAYPLVTAISAAASLILVGILPFLPKDIRDSVTKVAIGAPFITLVFAYATWTSRHMRRAAVADEKAIVELTVGSLEKILAVPFTRKPLQREQIDTLRTLLKRQPNSQLIRTLLESNGA